MKDIYFKSGYAIKDQFATHFLTLTVCGWIDLFTRKVYKDILIDSLKYCHREKGLVLYAYVIMSNHMHIIARADKGFTLSEIIRDFKKFTHKTMLPIIQSEQESRRLWMLHQFKYYGNRNSKNEHFQIWTNNNHAEECFGEDFTDVKLNYIHQNPVRAGIVKNAEDYLYSSAGDYYSGVEGLIKVELL